MSFVCMGLTGGIASGKSTVRQWLAARSSPLCVVEVVDADVVGHEAYAVGTECNIKLVEHFGDKIKNEDGTINRKALGPIVFGDAAAMQALQAIVWPEICKMLIERIETARKKASTSGVKTLLVIEAAIMLEAKWNERLPLDVLVAVVCDPEVAKERLMARNQLSSEDAENRISSQMTNPERISMVDLSIENSSDSVRELESELSSRLWEGRIEQLFK